MVTPYKPQDDFPNLQNNGNGQGHGVSDLVCQSSFIFNQLKNFLNMFTIKVPLTPSPGPASPMCGPPSAFSINSASSDLSDRAPLLARFGDRGRAGPAAGELFF